MASHQSDDISQPYRPSFSSTSPSRQPTPFYAYFGKPDPSTLASHQRQYLAMVNASVTPYLPQTPGLAYSLSQTPTPILMDPTGQRARVTQMSTRQAAPTVNPAHMAPTAGQENPAELLSPASHRATQSSLRQMMNTEYSSLIANAPRPISAVDRQCEPATVSNNLPIGSLVHSIPPPAWGVIKISNIPYSVTKQEIIQFVGRQARMITSDKSCPIHIIMERSTAKTMDCYVEFETATDAAETVDRINKVYEVGRAPRLGNRHVDVELSNQDQLLKDLFPRAKCIVWNNGVPHALANTDHYSTGFNGFFTSEEIVGAIRHAEIPHRSPFCVKCPQRTYESTISTLYKFPWYATTLYTVEDRNQLFELTNRHISSLVSRIQKSNTIGLDQRLLRNLLYAGLNCPAFNDRQKYTLCVNSEDMSEIVKFPDFGKWFPFDTLVTFPCLDRRILQYYAGLISKGTVSNDATRGIPNRFPPNNPDLSSPFGRVWFEWSTDIAESTCFNEAVLRETAILHELIKTGWEYNGARTKLDTAHDASSISDMDRTFKGMTVSLQTNRSRAHTESFSNIDAFATPTHRPAMEMTYSSPSVTGNESIWGQRLWAHVPNKARDKVLGHRITQSSPNCLPSEDH